MMGDHLLDSSKKYLSLSDDQRIIAINSDKLWIEYPQVSQIMNCIENLLKVESKVQAPCMLVSGDGGSGKSSIVNQVKNLSGWKNRLIYIALNQNPQNLTLRELLIDSLELPLQKYRNSTLAKTALPREILEVIILRGIKGVVIDEFNDGLLVPKNEQLKNLSLLKGLSGPPYHLSIIGFGTLISRSALSYDPQLSRRFYKVDLEDWKETEEFRSFLVGIEENIPLKRSSALYGQEIVNYLLVHTQGRMDGVVKLIRCAASYAVRTGEERITINLLERARLEPFGY